MSSRGPNETLIGIRGSRHQLGTPALVLDLDVLDANIASLEEHAALKNYEVRPVSKIHKSVAIAHRQVAAGGIGTCCATLAEAEVMVRGGISDVMLFTSVVTSPKLSRLAALNEVAEGLTVVVDHSTNVAQLGEAACRSGRSLEVLVDVEMGSRRTGIADQDSVVDLAQRIVDTAGLEYAGVQGYGGGHMTTVDFEVRRKLGHKVLEPLVRTVERLHAVDLAPRIVSGGGTGTHDIDHELDILTEIQAGTYVFMDMNYWNVEMRRDDPHPFGLALFVRSTVIGNAQPGFVITDAGLKEVDVNFGLEHPEILRGAPAGATYSVVGDDLGRVDFAHLQEGMEVGDVVEIMPPHCYQTVTMYPYYHVVRGDELVDIWPVDALANW